DQDLMVLPDTATTDESRLVRAVQSADGNGARTSYVDAVTGEGVQTGLRSKSAAAVPNNANALAWVFNPNPVAKTQNLKLRDHGDRAGAVSSRAYTRVLLHRLARGKHTLVGKWVRITNPHRVVRPNNRFLFK